MEGLLAGIMGIGSHISLESWGCIHHDQFYKLGFVISMFCWQPLRNMKNNTSLHIWWQRQVAVGEKNATAKGFLCIELAIYMY